MKTTLKFALAAGLMIAGAGITASSASALPMSGLDPAVATSADVAQGVENVRWVCGPYGCHWAPGWRYYGYRPYYGGYGWRGYGWHRWHRW